MFSHNNRESTYLHLSQVELGRKYLRSAIEKGQEKDIVSALHNVIDAIVWDISKSERKG